MAKRLKNPPGTHTEFLKQLEQSIKEAHLDGTPGGIHAFIPGTPAADAIMYIYVPTERVKIPANGNHFIYADTPPQNDWTASIEGASGIIVAGIQAGQDVGSFDFPMGDAYLEPGQPLVILAPSTADSEIKDIAIAIEVQRAEPGEGPADGGLGGVGVIVM